MRRIDTGFGRSSTTADVTQDIDLSGKRAIVTGGSSGLGAQTARALADRGAEVTLAVRDVAAGARVAAGITAATGNDRVLVAPLELADGRSLAHFTRDWRGPLDILINNAGGISRTLRRTPQGWEMQFATQHLGHFALALGLHPALATAGGARIVSVTSSGHLYSPVVFDDIHFNYRPYQDVLAYGQAKTAQVLFGVAASRRWADDGITANAAMPGPTLTNYQRNMDPRRLRERLGGVPLDAALESTEVPPGFKTVPQGAATSVLLATSPALAGIGGRYFEDCAEAMPVPDNNGYKSGVAPYALDERNADRLWELSVASRAIIR